MAFVETSLGGRSYRIDCADEQLERLTRLTKIVEARAAALERSGGGAVAPEGEDPEHRFLLLTALLVADLLVKAEEARDAAQAERHTIEQAAIAAGPHPVEEAEIVSSEVAATAPSPQGLDRRAEDGAQDPTLDPEIEAALAELFESAAGRIAAAAEALERI